MSDLRKEHNCIYVGIEQVHRLPTLHHDACTDQMKECKDLTFPRPHLQNSQDHILQEMKGPLQQVLAILYPEYTISLSIIKKHQTKKLSNRRQQ